MLVVVPRRGDVSLGWDSGEDILGGQLEGLCFISMGLAGIELRCMYEYSRLI